ncbi:unnamed protein product [Lymnaea stagnalis]|uniref:C2H2-type domain-containing protein n=1 Tax=Lymnaea stagnalis TaxID=6523 RepID=A0AAV2HTM6_LYMST
MAGTKKANEKKESCEICQQVLGSKKHLLFGAKCIRFGIREKLKAFLHPQDFKALFNERTIGEPRICNLCFITIKQISKGIGTLRELFGDPINVKLYKPHRCDWDHRPEHIQQQFTNLTLSSFAEDAGRHNQQTVTCSTHEKRNRNISGSRKLCLANKAQLIKSQPNHELSVSLYDLEVEEKCDESDKDGMCDESDKDVINKAKAKENKRLKKYAKQRKNTVQNKLDKSDQIKVSQRQRNTLNPSMITTDNKQSEARNDEVEWSDVLMVKRGPSCRHVSSPILTTLLDVPHQSTKSSKTRQKRRLKDIDRKDQNLKTKKLKKNIVFNKNNAEYNSLSARRKRRNCCARDKKHDKTVEQRGRYRCTYQGCEISFVRKDKYELHLCTHSPESILYCEKCGKKFGCQRYLDVHYKVHEKNERNATSPPEKCVSCDVSGCDRKFTSRIYMKRHVISYHMGKRPLPVPGIYYSCTFEGCSKKFSLKSTLSRHRMLVHKGGDYKLGRDVVKYPCTYEDCGEHFNRKNLLEKHLVLEHNKPPTKMESLPTKELQSKEHICIDCGMVLPFIHIPHHQKMYHSLETTLETHPKLYLCNMVDCQMEFSSEVERRSHVESHLANPPLKCTVDECKETFFLPKSLDNHLWNHCKKRSTCDVNGCSQTFDDQLQLAKHSKIHFDGKMKCPWRNCSSIFKVMGTLKQHILAHSRCLKANFGGDFVCNVCDLVFASNYGLKTHKRIHGAETSDNIEVTEIQGYRCEEQGCQAEFTKHKDFFDHFLNHYVLTDTSCEVDGCKEKFSNLLQKSKHGKMHFDGKYHCPWDSCVKTFASSFFHVKKHVYRHVMSVESVAAGRPLKCSHCDMVFRLECNLTNHTSQHSEKSDYVCPVCGKKFRHNHLKRHMLTHRLEKPHACSHCGLRYGTVNGLKFHILQSHGIGKWPYKCSFCEKGFISSTELRRHLPSHTKEKPFSCSACGVSFATHTGYKGHMRKHSGQKYTCDVEGCDKEYTTPLSLKGHKAQHAGFSKTCSYCAKTYNNPYGHKCKARRGAKFVIAEQGQKFVCNNEGCGKEFTAHSSLQEHMTQHTGINSISPYSAQTHTDQTDHQCKSSQDNVNAAGLVAGDTNSQLQMDILSPATDALVKDHQIHRDFMLTSSTPVSDSLPQSVTQGLTLHNNLIHSEAQSDFTSESDIARTTNLIQPGVFTANSYCVYWDPVLSIELL